MTQLIIFVALLVGGYAIGAFNERRHYASIRRREEEMRGLMLFASRDMPETHEGWLVMGNTVVSIDYFKRFITGLRQLVGGQLDAYESLVERARREAILRMKSDALTRGATHIVNVKLETSRVFYDDRRRSTGSVEVLAYGTAIRAADQV
mgnify:CR=1 FL=1|jgi:uncharacterized protein YbjQ (UPF0145 family)